MKYRQPWERLETRGRGAVELYNVTEQATKRKEIAGINKKIAGINKKKPPRRTRGLEDRESGPC
jgi:hypothetical protein